MQSTCENALIVEHYPRTSIVVTVQEMQDRGNVCMICFIHGFLLINVDVTQLLSTCLNASCMALMDSGIAMHHLFAAVSCAVDAETDEIIVNPNELQINVR